MSISKLAAGVTAFALVSLLTAATLGERTALARGTGKPKIFACATASACLTANNKGGNNGVTATSAALNGVQGNTTAGRQPAVYGQSDAQGTGVTGVATGTSTNSRAMFGDGGANAGVPVIAQSESDYAYLFEAYNNATKRGAFVADTDGALDMYGLFYSAGSCQHGCAGTRRRIVSYESRETEPTTEDVGEAQMRDGEAVVALDATFAHSIDERRGYAVFLTAEGDTNGLYVARRTVTAFIVREQHAGRSTLPFVYRIVAHPSGVPAVRLPLVDGLREFKARLATAR